MKYTLQILAENVWKKQQLHKPTHAHREALESDVGQTHEQQKTREL